MKVILVVLAFTLQPNGDLAPAAEPYTMEFQSLERCNEVGRNFRNLVALPQHVKTITVCLEL